mmetsp:Transcript_57935/g.69712  ORF Transcript_57935/g.69712 Transcript_57935/m.69712 type:complete len:91 (+) Transcript_57935:174-446(+)
MQQMHTAISRVGEKQPPETSFHKWIDFLQSQNALKNSWMFPSKIIYGTIFLATRPPHRKTSRGFETFSSVNFQLRRTKKLNKHGIIFFIR